MMSRSILSGLRSLNVALPEMWYYAHPPPVPDVCGKQHSAWDIDRGALGGKKVNVIARPVLKGRNCLLSRSKRISQADGIHIGRDMRTRDALS